jgi:hypothetical protein
MPDELNGICYDNGMVESFLATIKKTHVFWNRYRTRDEARSSILRTSQNSSRKTDDDSLEGWV